MSNLAYLFLIVSTVASSVSVVMHVLGRKYPKLEDAADKIDEVQADLPKPDPNAKPSA